MGRLSDKIKIVYLILEILFALGVVAYLLDTWGLIKLEETLTFLKKEPPRVSDRDDNPTLLEMERMKKERERLEDKDGQLKEKEARLKADASKLQKLREDLKEIKKGLEEEKKKIAEARAVKMRRELLIRNMAERLGAMPPDNAVAIVSGWSNSDLVDVFKQMEKNAAEAGQTSIVPFLITKLPGARAQVITNIMMDSEATKLPKTD